MPQHLGAFSRELFTVAKSSPHLIALILLLVLSSCWASAQTQEVQPSASDIAEKLAACNVARAENLVAYTAERVYEASYKGLGGDKRASMKITMSYLRGEKTFTVVSEDGSKVIRNRVLRKLLEEEKAAATAQHQKDTALNPDNYEFEYVRTEPVRGRPAHVLEVVPKRKSKYVYVGTIWVDAADYAVVRIRAKPAKNPSFWISGVAIEHEYRNVNGFWLPASNVSNSKVRLGGNATLQITYGEYQILETKTANNAASPALPTR